MNLGTVQAFIRQKNFTSIALTPGTTVVWNLDTGQVASLLLNRVTTALNNPTNLKNGGTYAVLPI